MNALSDAEYRALIDETQRGEVIGAKFFELLMTKFPDSGALRHKLLALHDLELCTAAILYPVAYRLNIPLPSLDELENAANILAATISSWDDLVSMLLEYAPAYVAKLNGLAAAAADADRVALEFVASHERSLLAFAQAEVRGDSDSGRLLDWRQILSFQSGSTGGLA
jgi:hypothetical protein